MVTAPSGYQQNPHAYMACTAASYRSINSSSMPCHFLMEPIYIEFDAADCQKESLYSVTYAELVEGAEYAVVAAFVLDVVAWLPRTWCGTY